MNNLISTLLAGSALCALAAAPALAGTAPKFHLVGLSSRQLTMHSGAVHSKTNIRDPNTVHYTITHTFTSTVTASVFYKKPKMLWKYDWMYTSSCIQTPNQKGKLVKRPHYGKVKSGTVTGTVSGCTGIFTFIGPVYTLTKKVTNAKDFFVFDVDATFAVPGKTPTTTYKLKLMGNTVVNIIP